VVGATPDPLRGGNAILKNILLGYPGGVTVELFDDAVFTVAPLTRRDALELIGHIRGQRMLDGFRGAPPVDREEIDINPLICGEEGSMAADATIILE
jgi:hypothetical protein